MNSLTSLAHVMLKDLGMMCSVDTARDGKTVSDRIKAEGESFLTITLPDFGKSLERALDQGQVADDHFVGFRRNGGLPAFLRGFLQQIFDAKSGTLLDEPSVEAIFAVRQFTLAFGKIFELPTPRRKRDAMRQFIQTEQEVRAHVQNVETRVLSVQGAIPGHEGLWGRRPVPLHEARHRSPRPGVSLGQSHGHDIPGTFSRGEFIADRTDSLGRMRRLLPQWEKCRVLLYEGILGPFDSLLWRGRGSEILSPQHGPGATADRRKGNRKYLFDEWPSRLEDEFPFTEWAIPRRSLWDLQDRVTFLTPEQEWPVRVTAVPKTAKTPRIIAQEPTAMQYIQQAMHRYLVDALESNPLTGPMIGFLDQNPNRVMARQGSLDGSLATLDMSEASDRVSNLHVMQMLAPWPTVSRSSQACRSTKADVPGYGVVPLAKFASMGSALTFPIEAMLFLSIVLASIASTSGSRLTSNFFMKMHGKVRVFGDDIVIPAEFAESVSADLEAFGLKVNSGKSFWTGLFRESCGGDYYAGHDVGIVKVRRRFPRTLKDAEEVVSLVSLRNQFYETGLWKTAGWLDSQIVRVLPHYPIVEPTSSILGRWSYSFPYQAEKMHADRQSPQVEGYVQASKLPENSLDDYPALMKWFLVRDKAPSGDPLSKDHLLRSGRPFATHLNKRWSQPY